MLEPKHNALVKGNEQAIIAFDAMKAQEEAALNEAHYERALVSYDKSSYKYGVGILIALIFLLITVGVLLVVL